MISRVFISEYKKRTEPQKRCLMCYRLTNQY